jgi:hypothetical protein
MWALPCWLNWRSSLQMWAVPKNPRERWLIWLGRMPTSPSRFASYAKRYVTQQPSMWAYRVRRSLTYPKVTGWSSLRWVAPTPRVVGFRVTPLGPLKVWDPMCRSPLPPKKSHVPARPLQVPRVLPQLLRCLLGIPYLP